MFPSGKEKKASAKKASTPRKKSVERSVEGTEGYSCTLYKDYLVFYGGEYDGKTICDASVYNIKEERMEVSQQKIKSLKYSQSYHAACYYEEKNIILFVGGTAEQESSRYGDQHVINPALQLIEEQDGLSWDLMYGLKGPFSPSPVCNLYEKKLYVYQPGPENGSFGELHSYDLSQNRWQELPTVNGNMRLRYPSQKAIFVQNKLYLFTMIMEEKPRVTSQNGDFIEDIYVLNLSEDRPEWGRVSFSDQAPGILTNISMVEANGIIYILGSSSIGEEEKSVLWTYDTDKEIWDQIQDIGTLTARPNQRAVIYKGQLLIVDWNYKTQTVGIQYQSLRKINGDRNDASISKSLCKDQAENFLQDVKSLYDGRPFSDVIFEVEGEEIPAHKAVLASRSNYFMKMFTSGMSESQSAKINIPNMKSHIFKAILQYIYCNEVELDEQLALDLIPVVDEYLMNGLKGLCEKYLCKELRKENVVDLLIVADRHEIEELKKACFKFILKNLDNIDENEEMMKLSKSLFIELLKFSIPGSQQKSHAKTEKKEEKKSTLDDRFTNPNSKKLPATVAPRKKAASKKRASSKESIND